MNTRPPAVTITPPLWGEPVRSPATLPSGTSQSFWSELHVQRQAVSCDRCWRTWQAEHQARRLCSCFCITVARSGQRQLMGHTQSTRPDYDDVPQRPATPRFPTTLPRQCGWSVCAFPTHAAQQLLQHTVGAVRSDTWGACVPMGRGSRVPRHATNTAETVHADVMRNILATARPLELRSC